MQLGVVVKLSGIVVVLAGVFGEIFCWNEKRRKRIEQMESFEAFLNHSIYRLETQKSRMQELLSKDDAFSGKNNSSKGLLSTVLDEINELMKQNRYPSGIELWKDVWTSHKAEWNVTEQVWGWILDSGNGYFGNNLKENLAYLRVIGERLNVEIQEEKNRWKEKQKVFTPVGIFGGIMIVIILL